MPYAHPNTKGVQTIIPKKPFGRTEHDSTRILFGGAALWTVTQAEADATLDLLLEHGINHIDTAASYGESERRIGPWMKHYRNQFFLATKTEERTRLGARDSLHRSLDLLPTDCVDLFQIHNLSDPNEWEIALGPGGALEAFVEARQRGLVRFIGITGHGTNILGLRRTPEDQIANVGIIACVWIEENRLLNVTEFAEKPTVDYARTNLRIPAITIDEYLTVFGLYIIKPRLFESLGEHINNNVRERGEFQLTSALDRLRREEGF